MLKGRKGPRVSQLSKETSVWLGYRNLNFYITIFSQCTAVVLQLAANRLSCFGSHSPHPSLVLNDNEFRLSSPAPKEKQLKPTFLSFLYYFCYLCVLLSGRRLLLLLQCLNLKAAGNKCRIAIWIFGSAGKSSLEKFRYVFNFELTINKAKSENFATDVSGTEGVCACVRAVAVAVAVCLACNTFVNANFCCNNLSAFALLWRP